MHSVQHQESPACLESFKLDHRNAETGEFVWDLSSDEHVTLMIALAGQFGAPRLPTVFERGNPNPNEGICAYCERACSTSNIPPSANRVDHFHPRSACNAKTFEWTNLMYVCKRCNDEKDDGRFAAEFAQGYVNPRDHDVERYFSIEFETGKIVSKPNLDSSADQDIANRTIRDLRLNYDDTILNRNLPFLRRNYLTKALQTWNALKAAGKPDRVLRRWLRHYTHRSNEFSSMLIWAMDAGYFGTD